MKTPEMYYNQGSMYYPSDDTDTMKSVDYINKE